MTSNEADSTPVTAEEGVQQIPVAEALAVTEARDVLLAAIGQEAQLVVEKSAGQASAALLELARAYALVATRGIYGTLLGATVETSNVDQSPALLTLRGYHRPDILLSTDWVAEHLKDPSLR
ncbi:hypothetical protein ACWGNM_31620 [Streptomyces sp. NPDC055796]